MLVLVLVLMLVMALVLALAMVMAWVRMCTHVQEQAYAQARVQVQECVLARPRVLVGLKKHHVLAMQVEAAPGTAPGKGQRRQC